jgi:hypothetical protein
MSPQGRKKQRVLEGHSGCSVCQPETKAGKALERVRARREIESQMPPAPVEIMCCYWCTFGDE